MKSSGVKIDNVMYNAALSIFVQAQQLELAETLLDDMEQQEGAADVITYNTMMKGYARAGLVTKCTSLHRRMTEQGVQPSEVSFGILLDACINGSAIDTAAKLFNEMVEAGCPVNTVLLTTLIKGFTKANRVEEAMCTYRRMLQTRNAQPDLVTFSILITANCDAGKMDLAMELFESMIKLGCQPDEIVFNNLLSGCVKTSNVDLAWKLLADMVNHGVKPTNPTFSILLRLLTQHKRFDEAADLLWRADAEYGVQPEVRLFTQFAQACIRNRQGQRALEVFPTIVRQGAPDSQAPTTIIHACVTFNMLETAASMLNLLAEAGGKICAREANGVLDASLKKRKTATAATAMKAMQQLRIPVEPRLQEQAAKLNVATE
jgi:pentatricopeptide repeat protein